MLHPILGPSGKIPFLIRDDDTNYFTKSNILDSLYSVAWKKGFKVCLAVVPFQKGINDICVPPSQRNTSSHFSVSENRGLVDYLKEKIRDNKVEVLQHGYSHDNIDGRGEFGSDLDKEKEINLGKEMMKQSFNIDSKFFVPPGEDISTKNLKLIRKHGLIPIYRISLFDTLMRNFYVPSFTKKIVLRMLVEKYKNIGIDGSWAIRFVKPVIMSVGKHAITWSPAMRNVNLSSIDSLYTMTEKIIKSCMLSRDPVCIINHYHAFFYDWNPSITRKDLFNAWKKILTTFDKLKPCWKVTFSELYGRANKIHNIRMTKTGSKITLESDIGIVDLSFRTNRPLEQNNYFKVEEETNIITIEELLPKNRIVLYEK